MKILVDADACPVKGTVVRLAKGRGIPVIMISDTAHVIGDGYSRVVTVDKQRDSADYKLMELIKPDDIAVTQDFGLAAMVLGGGARAINQNGLVYTNENIDGLLFERHMGAKLRRSGKHTKGPARRTKQDDIDFETAFTKLMEANPNSHI